LGEVRDGDAVLKAGDSSGAVSLLGGSDEARELSVRIDGRLLVVGRREFTTLMRRVPGFAAGVAEELARRLGRTA
jgi:hypothetical protein